MSCLTLCVHDCVLEVWMVVECAHGLSWFNLKLCMTSWGLTAEDKDKMMEHVSSKSHDSYRKTSSSKLTCLSPLVSTRVMMQMCVDARLCNFYNWQQVKSCWGLWMKEMLPFIITRGKKQVHIDNLKYFRGKNVTNAVVHTGWNVSFIHLFLFWWLRLPVNENPKFNIIYYNIT